MLSRVEYCYVGTFKKKKKYIMTAQLITNPTIRKRNNFLFALRMKPQLAYLFLKAPAFRNFVYS